MRQDRTLSGKERVFPENEIIVSKTDVKGRITYANDVFSAVSGYTEDELLGQPHSIVRHPEMPRAVFWLLWDTIQKGDEIFAYVNNLAKNGDNYWVLAHITPWFDAQGRIAGYHSFRRLPRRAAIDTVRPIYRQLLEIEAAHGDRKEGMMAAVQTLTEMLNAKGVTYDRFVHSL